MLLSVPGGKSSLALPETVTRPSLVGCLNWRCPPRLGTRYQPSFCNSFKTALTFMPVRIADHCQRTNARPSGPELLAKPEPNLLNRSDRPRERQTDFGTEDHL